MPSPLFADRPAPQLPAHDAVDALIHRTRRLRGDVDAVRRDAVVFDEDDPQLRWQRALCELAVQHLDNLDQHLGQLRAGLPDRCADDAPRAAGAPDGPGAGSLLNRVGSAEWNLLTDESSWSEELYEIFGRPPGSTPLSLDDLPSVLLPEDQPVLTAMVTGCLVDGRPMDGEFRIVRPDGRTRTLHMTGEPVLDAEGCTASMWAVLRDVSELRRSEQAVSRNRASVRREEHIERTEHRMAVELQEAVLPPWRGSLRLPSQGPGALDIAAHYLPSESSGLIGGDWYDAMELPDGRTLLTVGDLTGHGIPATSAMAMMLGALRGMAVAGIEPGALMGHLNQVLETSMQPALGSALCCRFDPDTSILSWAQAGHPAPLLFRHGSGRLLPPPDGMLLGAASNAVFEQDEVRLYPGDVLVLHTDGLTRRGDRGAGPEALLALAPRFADARTAQECVRSVVEEFGGTERLDDACVLVARIGA
ncbi:MULTISPECIES: PP2C family protein-serine/threonine phosphatase [Streptomyces]|uniref:PP2C family protein-serine/threonine phosphatase n=1 Tax=Streptomyces TaxID=1883 RepID=UPI000241A53C|nr:MULTISPECIES: SpoIIE family protein phosphatase [Streptomyces]EHM24821.1 putative PAS/PAC sensor protein [Streptomyces sp. W007]MCX4482561.1 SpoIIE family protein phosphatase [Streptomyces anulatus]MCX4506480.1 SpoIIE family protein phosphatase [Streptomyces anulatus]WTD30023.1 SpoIIE family protein phosphatase [Streptomyces anulatus]